MAEFHTAPKKSVLHFFVLVFVLSLPFWLVAIRYPVQLLPGLPLSALGAFTPMVAALWLTYKNERLTAVSGLLKRSVDFKRVKPSSWYLVIVLTNPAIAILAFGLVRVTGTALPSLNLGASQIVPLFAAFFVAALGEEIGWSGYAIEPLQEHWGTIRAGLLLGLAWTVWHFVPLLQAGRTPEWIAWWSLVTLSLRLIMTLIFIKAGKSVFAATLFHTLINVCWQLFPIDGSYYDPRLFGLLSLGAALLLYGTQWFLKLENEW